jgi:hypothetical protein
MAMRVVVADVGWLWHRRLALVNTRALQNLYTGGHILGLKDVFFLPKIVFVGLVLKGRSMKQAIQARLLSLPRGA